MVKSKNQIFVALIVIVLVMGAGILYTNRSSLPFSIYQASGQYYIPLYTTVICDKLPEVTMDIWDLSKYKDADAFGARKDIYCGSRDLAGHYPLGCNFQIEQIDDGFFEPSLEIKYGKCSFSSCQITGTLSKKGFTPIIPVSNQDAITVQYTGANFLLDEGDIIIHTNSQPYGLWQFTGTGKVDILGTCDVGLYSKYQGSFPEIVKDLPSNNIIRVGQTIPIIIGQTLVQSPRMIVNIDGQAVYVEGPGGYHPTFTEDNKIYVDVRPSSFVKDNTIVCSPASPLCNDDGTAWQSTPDGKFCDKFIGIGDSYIQKDSTESCKMSCNEELSKLEFTNDCVKIGETCPSEKPFFNPQTQTCIAVGGGGLPGSDDESFLVWIVGGILLLIIVVLMITLIKKKQGSGGF